MKFSVIVTRDCTESTTVEVSAKSPSEAEAKALNIASANDGNDVEWTVDDNSGDQSDPYTNGADPI